MKTLILETSSEKGCLVLADGEIPIGVQPLAGGPELSKRLGAETDALLKKHSFAPDLIAVGTGPGSYTGIRVGAALAKALSYGWQTPLIGFCSLQAFSPSDEGTFAVLADARIGGVYALFGERKNGEYAFQKPRLISPSHPDLQNFSLFASPHPEAIQKRGFFAGTFIETSPDPALLARLVHRQFGDKGPFPLELTYLSSP